MEAGTIVQGISAAYLVRIAFKWRKMAHLFVATLGGPVFLLGEMRVAVNEPIVRQGSSTIVTNGIIFSVICLPDTEGVRLRPLVELG